MVSNAIGLEAVEEVYSNNILNIEVEVISTAGMGSIWWYIHIIYQSYHCSNEETLHYQIEEQGREIVSVSTRREIQTLIPHNLLRGNFQ
jgi:hypothetical protein